MRTTLLIAVLAIAAPVLRADAATPISDLARNTNAVVVGIVDRLTDEGEFVFVDSTRSVRVYVGPAFVPVTVGETVTVRGFVDDDLRLEIYARQITGADGTTHTFDHRYE